MAVKLHETKTTVESAIADGYAELLSLRDEVQEVVENMVNPDGERGQTLSETESTLSNFCDDGLEVPAAYGDLEVVYGSNRRKSQSRSDRRDEAVRMLSAAMAAIDGAVNDIVDDEDEEDQMVAEKSDAETLSQQIDAAISDADSCEFPGMYG